MVPGTRNCRRGNLIPQDMVAARPIPRSHFLYLRIVGSHYLHKPFRPLYSHHHNSMGNDLWCMYLWYIAQAEPNAHSHRRAAPALGQCTAFPHSNTPDRIHRCLGEVVVMAVYQRTLRNYIR